MAPDFTKLRDIFLYRQNESWQWEAGDELIELCGPPSKHGINDGGYAVLELAKLYMEENGEVELDFSISYLSKIRALAYVFSGRNRFRSISWSVHLIAGSPEVLVSIVDQLKAEGKKITTRNVMYHQLKKGVDKPNEIWLNTHITR